MFDTPHKTALKRKALSVPMRQLNERGLLKGRVLDFGCGKGDDAHELGLESFDPHFQPKMPKNKFDTITCNYVLNVVSEDTGKDIINQILSKLKKTGTAYVTVRNDVKVDTNSQRDVHLDFERLNLKGCRTYIVRHN